MGICRPWRRAGRAWSWRAASRDAALRGLLQHAPEMYAVVGSWLRGGVAHSVMGKADEAPPLVDQCKGLATKYGCFLQRSGSVKIDGRRFWRSSGWSRPLLVRFRPLVVRLRWKGRLLSGTGGGRRGVAVLALGPDTGALPERPLRSPPRFVLQGRRLQRRHFVLVLRHRLHLPLARRNGGRRALGVLV